MNNVIVIGLGYVGLPLAVIAARNGFKVIGFDIDESKIRKLKNGFSNLESYTEDELIDLQNKGNLSFVNQLPKPTVPSIFVIAVPTPLDENGNPDMSYLSGACMNISEVITDGSLVITESTSYVGTLTEFIKPKIEKFSSAKDLYFAVAPERIDPGNKKWNISNTPRVIGGNTTQSTKLASEFYGAFCEKLIYVSSPEVAEASKLLENTFRQVNIALVNEIATLAKSINISMHEVVTAAATKPFGFMPFRPSIGVGGHCIPIDPVYLSYSGDKNNVDLELVKLSNSKNYNQTKYILEIVKSRLHGNLSGKSIQIVGISYKKNESDTRESPSIRLINELRLLGANVIWHDPIVEAFKGETSQNLNAGIDLGIIVIAHDVIKFDDWHLIQDKVVDFSEGKQILGLPKFF